MPHRRLTHFAPGFVAAAASRAVVGSHRPAPRVRFADVTAASGIAFVNATGNPDRKDYIFEVKGGGVAALDYDDDGWIDLAFSRGSSLERWREGRNPGPGSTAIGRRHLRRRHAEGGAHPRGLGRGGERRRLRQ